MPFLSQAGIQSPSIQWSAFLASHSHPPGCLRGLNKVATLPIDADSYWIPGTRCVKLISIYLKSLCSCYKSVYHLETPQAGCNWQSRIFGRCGKKWLSTYLGGNIKRRGLVCRRLLYWLACSLWPPKMATSCALEPPCTVVMEGFYSGPADIFHAWPTHAVVKTRRLEEDGAWNFSILPPANWAVLHRCNHWCSSSVAEIEACPVLATLFQKISNKKNVKIWPWSSQMITIVLATSVHADKSKGCRKSIGLGSNFTFRPWCKISLFSFPSCYRPG